LSKSPKTIKELAVKLDRQERKAEKIRAHYRKKFDKIEKDVEDTKKDVHFIKHCVEKIDRTIHGEENTGNPGMMSRLIALEQTHYITKFFHSFWVTVKRPLFIAIIMSILTLLGFIIKEYLTR